MRSGPRREDTARPTRGLSPRQGSPRPDVTPYALPLRTFPTLSAQLEQQRAVLRQGLDGSSPCSPIWGCVYSFRMASECPKCGAPRPLERVICDFCKTPYDLEEARRAIPCPRCKDLFVPSTQKCPKCDVWLVVSCVFCGALSPHTRAACDACGEVFAGAQERKAARQQQQQWAPPARDAPPLSTAGPSFEADAWSGAGAPQSDVDSLFSDFGTGPAEPAPAPGTSWDLDAWTRTKK
jgi:hypothetical protein